MTNSPLMDTELVDIIDDQGTITEQVLKTEAHQHGWLHKTVIGVLRYGNDWALVRQAPDRQDAGQLVVPVGGHVAAGESELEALLREAEEEIGAKSISYQHIGNKVFHRQVIGRNENHLFVIYEIRTDDSIILNAEAVSIERFTIPNLKQTIREQPQNFGDSFYFLLESFYPDYLPDGYQARWS